MLTLDRQVEVSLHGQAADIEWTMERFGPNNWRMTIEAPTKELGIPLKKLYCLTDAQASATLALFIGELEQYPELNSKLYEIAEEIWSSVELHFRPIP